METDLTYTPKGQHLIAGQWVDSREHFLSEPAHGQAFRYAVGTPALVERACRAAAEAFLPYSAASREARATFLETVAREIDERGEAITEIATSETGLPPQRITGERGRTTLQLKLFAAHIREGAYLDRRKDPALPNRQPAPRPEIRMIQRPIGPVAVFGASNFPLAFSTAGGDTAAALAAGCPVVVKGHSAHPGTGEIVAEAILAAISKCGMPAGVFNLIQGGNRKVGEAVVTDPRIRAVGFTGSLAGGRALFDLCAARPEPIPFFGELGSVNPMFLLPAALASRGTEIGIGWAQSLTMGAGQFCTNPGIAVAQEGEDGDAFLKATAEALAKVSPQTMLTDGIAAAYKSGKERFDMHKNVRTILSGPTAEREASPDLFEVSAEDFILDRTLGEEVFGPLGLVIRVPGHEAMLGLAECFEGQLTATLHMDDADKELARTLLPALERMAGRVLANGFPTGVEVIDSMVHGGPYPASTNFGATSVGTLSIRRFLRPVAYQNFDPDLLPESFED